MASDGHWSMEKLSQLSNEDTRLPVLMEIKDHLQAIPRNEIARTANSLQLPLIFDCLNDSNSEQIDCACEVLTMCMESLDLGESTHKYGMFLEKALTHPLQTVKVMALKEIKRNVDCDDILITLCKRQSLLENVIKCIADPDLEVAKQASGIITTLGMSIHGIRQLATPEAIKVLHDIMGTNEVVRLRVYEVLIKIAVQSEENLNILKSTGLLTQILAELDNNDLLLRLNIVELLAELVETSHGYDFLESSDILKKLLSMMDDNDQLTMQLCEPGILKFFGNVAHCKPMIVLSKYPNIVQRVYDNLESDNFTLVGVSLDTIGFIGSSNEGKIVLDSLDNRTDRAITIISQKLPSLPSEFKVRALNCLENLLRVIEFNAQISLITKKWFSLISENPIDFVLRYAKNPFFEFRLAGFGILSAIASQSWGQEIIRNTPGLVEFLLDRNVETIKECKEAKYNIIKLLATSSLFDAVTTKRFQMFTMEGPFYVQTMNEVATERND